MKDSIIRALGYDGQLRVSAVVTTELCEELRKRHDTFPVATAALGRAVSATLLFSSFSQLLTLIFFFLRSSPID